MAWELSTCAEAKTAQGIVLDKGKTREHRDPGLCDYGLLTLSLGYPFP